jgi:ribulose-phosphate 3-epimerase
MTWIDALPKNRLIAEYSMWSADLIDLRKDLERIATHADVLHIDVADGHFAPAFLFFPDAVAAIRKAARIPIHVHLMVDDKILLEQVEQFAAAGSDLISVHAENKNAKDALAKAAALGAAGGVVLKVETPVSAIAPFLPHIRWATLLGTAIGVKGQGLNEQACPRLIELHALPKPTHRIVVAADGGIRDHTVPELRKAGAETVVLGSLAFGAPDLKQRMDWLHAL